MPVYDYKCKECGHEFESIQKMSDSNPPCKKCGFLDTKKIIRGANQFVQYKGPDWSPKSFTDLSKRRGIGKTK